jgi:hypothetical protein
MSLKSRLRDWLLDNKNKSIGMANEPTAVKGSNNNMLGGGMVFTLHAAEGGQVMEFGYYDPKADRHVRRLYIVNDGDDFAQQVAHIITLEAMRR